MTTRVLLLRLDAPLIAFGGVVVDAKNITDEMPSRSMLTGLLGNALGYDHRDVVQLGALQSRLRVAARRDREGELLVDFQTVDLGQDFLTQGWTTWGRVEGREGGSAASGTHIRYRHYLADSIYTVALALSDEQSPTLDELAAALDEPARPLFIGRKACLPSTPLLMGIVKGTSLLDVLRDAPLASRGRRSASARCLVRVPRGTALPSGVEPSERAVTEDRDWPNQIHTGRSIVWEAHLECGAQAGGAA